MEPPLFNRFLPCLLTALFLAATANADVRTFTDKKGTQIEAELLEVLPDQKSMKIRRADGAEFTTVIVNLSLDDQQYIKDWMVSQPMKTDFRLEVDITRKSKGEKSSKRGSYTLDTAAYNYEVTIENSSRDTLPSPKVFFAILRSEELRFIESSSDGELTYDYMSKAVSDNTAVTIGEMPFQDLAYLKGQSFSTDSVEIDQMVYGNDIYREDELLGMMIRVETSGGDLVGEYYSDGAKPAFAGLSWDEIQSLPKTFLEVEKTRDDDEPDEDMEDRSRIEISLSKGEESERYNVGQRTIEFSARLDPETSADEGVLFSFGNEKLGATLYLQDGKVIGFKTDKRGEGSVEAKVPLGEFTTGLRLLDSGIELVVNDEVVDSHEHPGTYLLPLKAALRCGHASDLNPVGNYEAPFSIQGGLREAKVVLGEITAEE